MCYNKHMTRDRTTNLRVHELHLGDVVKNSNSGDWGFNWMTLVKIADNGTEGKSYHFKRPYIHISNASVGVGGGGTQVISYIGMEDAIYYDWDSASFDLAPDRTSIVELL